MRGQDYFVEIASRPPLTKLHPQVGQFFRDYLAGEKAIRFGEQLVMNSHFPPHPSRAFNGMAAQLVDAGARRLYSVTWAVTNRCDFGCWHCYNAGRSQTDVPLADMRRVAGELQERGAVMVTLTGGEPLLRSDLEDIAAGFDERSCLVVGTTGWGLSAARAGALKHAGVWGMGISLDSDRAEEHDRLRGRPGAFAAALEALRLAREAGLYAYVVAVGTREFLQPDRFLDFLRFAGRAGALEVHLLEPCPTGRLKGQTQVVLTAAERRQIIAYQHRVAQDDSLPILSTFTYLEGHDAFGCGAGLTHIYIDGSGELCPCNLVPISFGNIAREPLAPILARMGEHFQRPRASCIGRVVTRWTEGRGLPTPPAISAEICRTHLPADHAVPRFVQVQAAAQNSAGATELTAAYDQVGQDYDTFWASQASCAVEDLVARLCLRGDEQVLEAGCGTGVGTALLARKLRAGGHVLAVDLSEGMIARARQRVDGQAHVEFRHGDALTLIRETRGLDLVFAAWVLGYIPLRPFFAATAQALRPRGRVALVVHRENSPKREFEAFAQVIAQDPSLLLKRVAFDFPRDPDHLRPEAETAGLRMVEMWEGAAVFRYPTAEAVLEHLLKSGAGTVFYDAVDPSRRRQATANFLDRLRAVQPHGAQYEVRHEYLACIAATQ